MSEMERGIVMPKFFKSLFGQVLLALLLGVVLGFAVPEFAIKLKPLGDGFIKLIKMIIPVLVFCVVVHGIAGAGDLKRVGRVGVKALVYFEVVTTIALVLGLVLAFWFQPGVGMNVDPNALDAKAMSAYASNADKLTSGGTVEFLMKLIPTTVVAAFANGDVLQVLLFAVLFSLATNDDCMFVEELGTIEQQRENINNAIGNYGRIIREIGALHGHERILDMAKASLERAQREKVEFELNHPESK